MATRKDLHVVKVAPLTLARGAAVQAVQNVRWAIGVVQTMRSAVKSVALISEPVQMETRRQVLNPAAVRVLPVGMQEVAVAGGLQMKSVDNTLTLSLKLDTYLLAPRLFTGGQMVAEASARFNSELRVVLRETIDATPIPPPPPKPRRLPRPRKD